VSVRDLVALACRSGDLRRGQGPRVSALEGAAAHRAIQASRPGAYAAERRLEARAARPGLELPYISPMTHERLLMALHTGETAG